MTVLGTVTIKVTTEDIQHSLGHDTFKDIPIHAYGVLFAYIERSLIKHYDHTIHDAYDHVMRYTHEERAVTKRRVDEHIG